MRDLLVSVGPGELRAGLVENGRIVELRVERTARSSLLGAIFLGRVQRVVPALPGAFIELDKRMDPGFLPSADKLVEGQVFAVQVVKDAFDGKPPEVTAALSFTGRFVTFTPQRPGVAVSRKLPADERARLSALLVEAMEEQEGGIARTHAAGASRDEIGADVAQLRARYAALTQEIARGNAPHQLDSDRGGLARLIDSVAPRPDRVLIDNRAAFATLRHGSIPVSFDDALEGLEEGFASALSSTVLLPGGGTIVIEETTGFTVIDVNTAAAAGGRGQADDSIRAVNLAAAREIAAQLRLRQIGGAVVIDFISMRARAERDAIEAALQSYTDADPVGVQLLGWTRLGHFELTRRRRGPSITGLMLDRNGAKNAETVALEALRALSKAYYQPGRLVLEVVPKVAALLSGPLAEFLSEAVVSAGRPIQIKAEPSRDAETFDIASGRAS